MSVQKESFSALFPLLIFVLLFVGTGIISGDFSNMPLNVAIIIASAVALVMNRKEKLSAKIEIFAKGAGHPNIMLLVVIFILAGAFAETAKGMGGVEATVNMVLSLIPSNLLMVGLFIVGCFISLSMGTSMGTVAALAPIGIGIAEQTGIPLSLAMGTVIGGAMFGDNLSMISDTTIAAVRTQGTKMSDKFKTNFLIVLPGAIVTAAILWIITSGIIIETLGSYEYEFIKVVPYIAVFLAALLGVNVLVVLIGGTILAGIIGLFDGSYTLSGFIQAVSQGIINMEDLAIVAILIGGMIGIIQHNGGIQWLLNFVSSKIKSKKGAEFGIAGLVSVTDIATANNTISIVATGPLAKNIADKYEIDPRKSASILDIFPGCWQGLVPYGGQMLVASGLAAISPISILPYSFYPILLGICGTIAILIGFPKFKDSKVQQEKDEPAKAI
ncbi:Na+/H+ antiporter NhaC family protein [Pallidibacillus pasinlerensis]|uniref:Na+/H+ antiporter NhaC family protein n=1 Tax=Pallidibacillus pasinlerensis TaxID=2703818 RepID=A0ABX0A0B3_9BACI|nr:Na+/H+ antiporter NhaC family protein [Pallidibacillus pasinlerensis]NCU16834.1 Na+/H+ antiporter NhaC family protein [Pallidibacillus pasinlerensis]